MGSRSRFAVQLALRVAALFGSLLLVAFLLVETRFRAVTTLAAAAALLQGWLLLRFVERSNRELARFLDSIRFDDLQGSFQLGGLGAGFGELQATFEDVLGRFRAARLEGEAQRRTLEALVEHAPIAILVVHEGGRVELANGAARRLLNATAATLDGLHAYGAVFQRDVAQCRAGERRLTRIVLDGVSRHLVLSATQLLVTGAPVRVVALQDIQTELDWNELTAWQDMASVLSHEIMNSLTPISSLARTADELVTALEQRPATDELVGDLHTAVRTLARRSDGLMRFVQSYRALTALPPPTPAPVLVGDYFQRLEQLMFGEWEARGVKLHVGTPPAGLTIVVDEALVDQALINLLRNAADAASRSPEPTVWLGARLSERGHAVIEIADNGPGVDPALGDRIFLPFFTTKPAGSGIGLALARQVMLVHQGAITTAERPGGGALFRLTF